MTTLIYTPGTIGLEFLRLIQECLTDRSWKKLIWKWEAISGAAKEDRCARHTYFGHDIIAHHII